MLQTSNGSNQQSDRTAPMDTVPYKTCYRCKQAKPSNHFHPHKASKDGLNPNCRICETARRHARENALSADEVARRKAKKLAYDIEHRKKTKAQRSEQTRARYLKNRRQRILYASTWVKNNPEKRSAISQNYKAKRRAMVSSGLCSADFRKWKNDQAKVCAYCGQCCKEKYHVDHILPLVRGGKHELVNLAISCPTCNLRKHSKTPDEFRAYMEDAA